MSIRPAPLPDFDDEDTLPSVPPLRLLRQAKRHPLIRLSLPALTPRQRWRARWVWWRYRLAMGLRTLASWVSP